jgi:hypothetical protein
LAEDVHQAAAAGGAVALASRPLTSVTASARLAAELAEDVTERAEATATVLRRLLAALGARHHLAQHLLEAAHAASTALLALPRSAELAENVAEGPETTTALLVLGRLLAAALHHLAEDITEAAEPTLGLGRLWCGALDEAFEKAAGVEHVRHSDKGSVVGRT